VLWLTRKIRALIFCYSVTYGTCEPHLTASKLLHIRGMTTSWISASFGARDWLPGPMSRNRFEAVSSGTDFANCDPNPPSRYRSPKMDSNISSPSNDEMDHSRERHEPDPMSCFLFVNETNDAPPYKVGYRHDIRSHVRKQTSKRKTRLKEEKMESKLKSLVPQAAEQDASKNLIEQKHSPSTLTPLPPAYTPSFKSKDSPGLINCLPYRSPSSASDWPTATDRKAPTIEFITDPTATASPKATVPYYYGGHGSSYRPYGEKPNNLKPN
jgi:hypothetical protein